MAARPPPRGPLHAVRVLDLSRILAGPLCTMLLGDLGADVIKVERPGTGDETRGWGPPFDERGQSAYFLSVNRNKRSIAADLDRQDDQALIERLIAQADVVVDNFLPGALGRRGLDPHALLPRHPRLIWCTITGFGAHSLRPGYDFVVQAECGWMAITGPADGEPHKVGVALADVITGKDAAIAILAALLGRGAETERAVGERPDERLLVVSLADSARAALVNVAQNALVTGCEAQRFGNGHPNLVPYQLFHAADQPVVIAVGTDSQWLACARALELPALADDPQLRSNPGRVAHRDRVVSAIAERVRSGAAQKWLDRLLLAGVPAGRVRTVLSALHEAGASPLTGVAPSVPGGGVHLPPPLLDEHGPAIRAGLWDAPSLR